MIGRAQLETALVALGELLAARGLHYEVVLVGGGNLILREFIPRPTTKDLDILGARTPDGVAQMGPVPEPLRDAVIDVGRAFGLADDWLNTGPDSLLDLGLPTGSSSVSSAATTAVWSHGWRAGSTWCASSSMPPWIKAPGAGTSRISVTWSRATTTSSRRPAGL